MYVSSEVLQGESNYMTPESSSRKLTQTSCVYIYMANIREEKTVFKTD